MSLLSLSLSLSLPLPLSLKAKKKTSMKKNIHVQYTEMKWPRIVSEKWEYCFPGYQDVLLKHSDEEREVLCKERHTCVGTHVAPKAQGI